MNHPFKSCALVGAGPRAATLARAMTDHPDVRLTAVCDPDPQALADFAAEFPSAHPFPDLGALLDAGRPDFAVVATPPRRHTADTLTLIEQRVPALVECPMVETTEEALALHEAAKRTGILVAMAESFCFLPAVQTITHLVRERRTQGFTEAVLGGEGHYLEMDTGLRPGGWRDDYSMARYITHALGPLLYATGQRARQVVGMNALSRRSRAQGPVLPMALVETDTGAVFYVANSGLAPRPLTRWSVMTETWCAESDPAGTFDGPVRIYDSAVDKPEWQSTPVSPQIIYRDLWGTGYEPERLMLRRFAAAVDGRRPEIDLAQSLNISLAGVAAMISAEEGNSTTHVAFADAGKDLP